MAYPKRQNLPQSAQHISREYVRAKKLGITQREFAEATGLGSARYLRKILAGERSGRVLESRAEQGGVLNVPITYKGEQTAIVQARLPYGTSRLDIYQPKIQHRIRQSINRAQQEERLKAKPPNQLSDYEKGKLYGKPQTRRIRRAKRVRQMPVAVVER